VREHISRTAIRVRQLKAGHQINDQTVGEGEYVKQLADESLV